MVNKRNDGNTSAKDEARTPPEIFRKLDAEFRFDVDAAANDENKLCFFFFDDALDRGWYEGNDPNLVADLECNGIPVARTFFCNPPYSNGNILKFVHKAWLESSNGATVVLLISSDCSTKYFEFCFENASEIRFMIPRVRFNNPDGTPFKGSPQTGSMIVVFRPGNNGGMAKVSLWRWKE